MVCENNNNVTKNNSKKILSTTIQLNKAKIYNRYYNKIDKTKPKTLILINVPTEHIKNTNTTY